MQFLIAVALGLFGAILPLHSQGYIVTNGVGFIPSGPTGGISIATVVRDPTNGDSTGFILVTVASNTFAVSPLGDKAVRVFLVSPNDPITSEAIASQSYPELATPNTYLFQPGVPFYLGIYSGYNPYDANGNYTGIYDNPVFGWGEFENVGSAIQFLGGALEIGGGGIYAGTQTIIPVPEPATWTLLVCGAGVFALRRRPFLKPMAIRPGPQ